MKTYHLRTTTRDDKDITQLCCPDCGKWGMLDEDQLAGKVSILCDCGFHETLNFNSNPEDRAWRYDINCHKETP